MSDKGKYDDLCEFALHEAQGEGALLIVLGGNKGTGFSASFVRPEIARDIPGVLRQVADLIEQWDAPPPKGERH